mmetsp:Transcript_5907/g.10279  ORF Transcript_5907/g.10279 Transcript_5907/m.10279 type:complete len:572 (+) Transcript_5907:58-1773(+)|eukprot:CAMPEP_0119106344 /NCGR_PEP_ID=MMETSP1180-20130426/4062_1 /TAXON_ID=3052 ORGANISM="Chlamydomonas cf sp, Strain CCMP681" /NCGR_SAMPLE_ID=MMETSP1180 /ASSEMBLY_ACC=CAM_ASM_000741 /LENGTH=571 /DNA_ID=CAMNT_0007091661 /DNA_START=58 /DNA_END=1773 /DNA_ORIENTATION=-
MPETAFAEAATKAPPRPHTPVDQREHAARAGQNRKTLKNLPSLRDGWDGPASLELCGTELVLSICVLGASGDLAKKKTYPALFVLFNKGFLPKKLSILGYARSPLTATELQERLRPFLKGEPEQIDAFLALCSYQSGDYSGEEGYSALASRMQTWEHGHCQKPLIGRLLYLALPPSVYPEVCEGLKKHVGCLGPHVASTSWLRLILEKPFGMDLASSETLASQIASNWTEEQIYRIDHYLGKELVQNMLILRFGNSIFSAWWNRHYISNVQITFKEPFGTEGRGGYFDQYGIIRDVIQNHLVQVLALVAMEPPVSLHPDDIRDEKVKLLRCVTPVQHEDCVLGQYVAADGNPGYKDDPTVPSNSRTPTFASTKLYIKNERWAGVPFIIKAGKALNERTAVVRIQLKTPPASLFGPLHHMRNELVIRFQPEEAIYAKVVVKQPGLEMEKVMSELDLTYPERYAGVHIPDAYERLILDAIRGDQQHFVRRDELRASWAIFTPLLHAIDKGTCAAPLPYPFGSRGPAAADDLVKDAGYTKTHYTWQSYEDRKDVAEATQAEATQHSPKHKLGHS